ncbi:hypothetical protein DVH05_020825 [Phytophthora capsici]|nr:hypothetical protein DVH05_008295 [Phytophthora capsici]KAG1690817.1 hypothetical protein DVH05_027419 [Phytophthora capsici]KAG1695184.1 hypothetical protein DVH05_020825 [Phytophthora capsici]|eukprot:jgi/Phyca11/103825/e_gw1.8.827.1
MAPKTPPSGRTSIKGVSKMPRQFVRTAVDNVKKAHIIKFYRSHGMVATVDKFYPGLGQVQKKTTKRQIYKWVEKEESIMDAVASGNGHLKKTRSAGLSAVLSEEDEDQIAHWVRDLRREGVPVSPFMLTCKAQEVAEDAGLPVGLFIRIVDHR